jgi:hypothetical protein
MPAKNPPKIPPNMAVTIPPRIARIRNAGIDAKTHFTMSVTIDMKGIFTSVMTTLFVFSTATGSLLSWPGIHHLPGFRVRAKISSQFSGVEAPAWQGVETEEYQAYFEFSQRSQAEWIDV